MPVDSEFRYPTSAGSTFWTPSKNLTADGSAGQRRRGIVASVAADQATAYGVRISDPWSSYVLSFHDLPLSDLDDLFDFENTVGAGSFVFRDAFTDDAWVTVMFEGEEPIDYAPDGNCTVSAVVRLRGLVASG